MLAVQSTVVERGYTPPVIANLVVEPLGAHTGTVGQAYLPEDRRNPEADKDETGLRAPDPVIGEGSEDVVAASAPAIPVGPGEEQRTRCDANMTNLQVRVHPTRTLSEVVVGATDETQSHAARDEDAGTWALVVPPLDLHAGTDGGAGDGNHGHARTEALAQPNPGLAALTACALATDFSGMAVLEDLDEQPPPTREEQREMATLTEGMTSQEAMAFARLEIFCSNIVKKLAPPLLK